MRPRVVDTFPFNNELDLLECRLTELYDAVDAFVLVEATVDHQDHPKPLHFAEHRDRYDPWKDKIVHVVADRLPTLAEDAGSWAREHAQREWIDKGLEEWGAQPDDIVLQSDVDEIPTVLCARNVRPPGRAFVGFSQRGHFWAIDWLYPPGWNGTVAGRFGAIRSIEPHPLDTRGPYAMMREFRNNTSTARLPNAGWHLSWLGGPEAARRKVGSFCHPEVAGKITWDPERFWREGVHVDDVKMVPVTVDRTWPKWLQDPANVPASWYRPR